MPAATHPGLRPNRIHLPIVAHRGNAAEFPENTLPAIQSAIALGVNYVEFDVQLAADGVPVVIHDADLKRTAGRAQPLFELPASALAKCSVHEPDRFGDRFLGTCIPTLEQTVKLLGASPGITAFVEIKRASLAHHGPAKTLDAVMGAAAPIRDHGVIISFAKDAIEHARSTGWRIGQVLESYDRGARRRIEALRPEFVFCNVRKLPRRNTPLWVGPWQWVLYEVGSADLARRLLQRGAHLLETMQVSALRDALLDAQAQS